MKKETTRKCIVTGKVFEKETLLRFVVLPDGTVVPDFKKKLPGKGVYVSNQKKLLQKAIANNLFAKVLKNGAKSGDVLMEQVENLLKKQALDMVSLAKKAGVLITGMDMVREALKKGKVAFLAIIPVAGQLAVNILACQRINIDQGGNGLLRSFVVGFHNIGVFVKRKIISVVGCRVNDLKNIFQIALCKLGLLGGGIVVFELPLKILRVRLICPQEIGVLISTHVKCQKRICGGCLLLKQVARADLGGILPGFLNVNAVFVDLTLLGKKIHPLIFAVDIHVDVAPIRGVLGENDRREAERRRIVQHRGIKPLGKQHPALKFLPLVHPQQVALGIKLDAIGLFGTA